jgi:hypothetical protein
VNSAFLGSRYSLFALLVLLHALAGCSGTEAPGQSLTATDTKSSDNSKLGSSTPETRPRSERVDVAATPSDVFDLRADQVRDYRVRALRGEAEAAVALVEYYNLRREWLEADIWTQIGAENGDSSTMLARAIALQRSGGRDSCERARFWLNRSLQAVTKEIASVDLNPKERASLEGYSEMLTRRIVELESDEKACAWSSSG